MANIGSITFQKDEKWTYEHMMSCLKEVGAEATFQTPPKSIGFVVSRSSGGFKYGCEGEATISPLPDDRSNVVVRVKSTGQTLAYTLGSTALSGILFYFLLRLTLGTFGALWGIVIAVAVGVGLFWQYSANFPGKVLDQIKQAAAPEASATSGETAPTASTQATSPVSARFCIHCGKQISAEATFCQYCGRKQ